MIGYTKLLQASFMIVSLLIIITLLVFCKFDDESVDYKDDYLKTKRSLELKNDEYNSLLNKYNLLLEEFYNKEQPIVNNKVDTNESVVELQSYSYIEDNIIEDEEIDYSDKILKFIDEGSNLSEDISFTGKIYSIYKNDYLYTVGVDYLTVFVLKSDYGDSLDSWGIGTMVNVICSKRYSYGYKDCSINLD